VDAEQMVAAAEEVVEQVELADDVQQVEQLGAGVEHDEIVAASIAADEVAQKAARATDCHTLLAGVKTCTSFTRRGIESAAFTVDLSSHVKSNLVVVVTDHFSGPVIGPVCVFGQ